jgi:hypothetical protein
MRLPSPNSVAFQNNLIERLSPGCVFPACRGFMAAMPGQGTQGGGCLPLRKDATGDRGAPFALGFRSPRRAVDSLICVAPLGQNKRQVPGERERGLGATGELWEAVLREDDWFPLTLPSPLGRG